MNDEIHARPNPQPNPTQGDPSSVDKLVHELHLHYLQANAAGSPDAVKLLIRPEVWEKMDGTLITSTAVSEWDRLTGNIPDANIAMSANALAVPTGTPLACSALLTTAAGGVAPIYCGLWGAVDLIRDPFTDAQSGGLRITALATMDVTVARGVQLQLLTGVQV